MDEELRREERRAALEGDQRRLRALRARAWVAPWREGRHRVGEQELVDVLAISPNGRCLAAASLDDPQLRVWDLGTGEVLTRITLLCHGLSVGDDGRFLAVGGGRLHRSLDERYSQSIELPAYGEDPAWRAGAVSPTGAHVAAVLVQGRADFTSRAASRVVVFGSDGTTHRELQADVGENEIDLEAVTFSGDGRTLAAWGREFTPSSMPGDWSSITNTVVSWDLESGNLLRIRRSSAMVEYSSSTLTVAVARERRRTGVRGSSWVHVYEPNQQDASSVIGPRGIRLQGPFAMSPNGNFMAIATGDGFILLGGSSYEEREQVHLNQLVRALTFSPDNRLVAWTQADGSLWIDRVPEALYDWVSCADDYVID